MTAETVTNAADKADTLASLAAELVNAAEARAREEVAQRITQMLSEASKGRSEAPQPAAENLRKWGRQACLALVEAQSMSSSIAYLVERAEDDDPDSEAFAMLEAIKACIDRIERFVAPALDSAPEVVSHD